jgi:IrrE N-terminal-like domain/Papain family cysteine protease
VVTQGPRWQRRVEAAHSALRLLDELNVDQSEQIDVFGLCEDLDLWLAFMPMDNLLGAFIPEGAGGVLITTQRPIPIQRFTAAHEIAHWRLDHGHGLALDGEEHVLGATPVEREQLAQVFAATLLMPPPLVFGVLERLGVDGTKIEPEHAYALAREAGVSYEAAVRHLAHLDVIRGDQVPVLLASRPLRIKANLALGRRPVSGYADVWPVDEAWDDQLISLRVEDEVVISLPENRSTGYRWMFPDEPQNVATAAPPTGHPLPALDPSAIRVARIRFAAETTENHRVPGAALERARSIATQPASDSARSRRSPAPGAELVGDEYMPTRAPWMAASAARRFHPGSNHGNGASRRGVDWATSTRTPLRSTRTRNGAPRVSKSVQRGPSGRKLRAAHARRAAALTVFSRSSRRGRHGLDRTRSTAPPGASARTARRQRVPCRRDRRDLSKEPPMLSYAQRRAASLLLPPVDLRQLIDPTTRAQGPRPLCLPFALTAAHEAARNLVHGKAELLAVEPLWQHCVRSRNAGDHGTTVDAVSEALQHFGQPPEAVWPYNSSLGAETEPTPADAVAAVFNASESFEVPVVHDGVEEPIETVLTLGLAVVLVLEITAEFEGAAIDGEIRVPPLNSPIGDYHAVTIVGAATSSDATTRRLLIRNSWGAAWGAGGHGWLPLDYLISFAGLARAIDADRLDQIPASVDPIEIT